jgi:hypothetical protein
MSIEAIKLALDALEWNLPVIEDYGDKEQLNRQHSAITALRQAIEQKQEPVACIHRLVDVTNPVVKSGYMCVDCGAVFRAYSESPPQQKQEPVGRFSKFTDGVWREVTATSAGQFLYASPPQRQPLTDEEIGTIATESQWGFSPHDDTLRFARAIEDAHGITGEKE